MDFWEMIGRVFGILFGISILWMFFAVPISEIGDRRRKKSIAIDRLEDENQSLKDEITRLKQDNYELNKKYRQAIAEINTKDTMIYNLGLDFYNCDPFPLIPYSLQYSYLKLLTTERLERAMSGEFSFQHPISISATTLSNDKYKTTLESCTCDDCVKGRTVVCKHMLALAIQVHAFTPYEDYINTLLNDLVTQNKKKAELLKEKEKLNKKSKKQQSQRPKDPPSRASRSD